MTVGRKDAEIQQNNEQFVQYKKAWADRENRLSQEKDQLADKNTELVAQIAKLKKDHEKDL